LTLRIAASGYRVPAATPLGATASMLASSSGVNSSETAAMFSSRCPRRVVPGI
jgi:hypothetical protein